MNGNDDGPTTAASNEFRNELASEQRWGGKTRASAALWLSLGIVMIGLGGGLALLIPRMVRFSEGQATPVVLWMLELGVGASFLVGFGVVLFASVRLAGAVQRVICPECSKRHSLFAGASFYCCTRCLLPLYPSPGVEELRRHECPFCERPFAVRPEHGSMRCLNCGAALDVGREGVLMDQEGGRCSSCGAPLPTGVFACKDCDALRPQLDPLLLDDSQDSWLARDRLGLTLHFRGSLRHIEERLEPPEPGDDAPEEPISLIGELHELLGLLLKSEVTDEACDVRNTLGFAREIDGAYALALLRAHELVVRGQESSFDLDTVFFLERAPHVAARAQLHEILKERASQLGETLADVGCPDWASPVLSHVQGEHNDWVRFDPPLGFGTVRFRVKNPEPLRKEALRISAELGQEPDAPPGRVVVGQCESCGRSLRVKAHAVRDRMHLTCKCGHANDVIRESEQAG